LVVEFGLRKIPFRQQPAFDVVYKGQKVGLFVPDLVAFDSVVVALRVKTNSGERVWLGGHAGDGGQWVPSRRRAQPTAPTNLLSPKKAWWLLSLGCASCSIKERRFLCAIISTRTRSHGRQRWAGPGWTGVRL